MQTFARDGLTFDVRDDGPEDGEPVVLLHGFPQDGRAWAGVTALLGERGLRTLVPDQRGYSPGARPAGRRHYQLREAVDDVLALLDTADLDRAHVVGHDWGGAVAWALGAWYPDRLRTVTSVSTPHPAAMQRAWLTSGQVFRSWYMGAFQVPFLPEATLLARDCAALRRALSRSELPEAAVDHYVERMLEPDALSAALNWYRAIPWSIRDRVGTVRVPTLHVWSTGDPFLGRAATEVTARFVDAPYRLEVFDGVSHWIPETASHRLADLLAAHCAKVPPATG